LFDDGYDDSEWRVCFFAGRPVDTLLTASSFVLDMDLITPR